MTKPNGLTGEVSERKWTEPYYGVSHLNGLKSGFQITTNDLGTVCTCHVFVPGHGFSATESLHDSLVDAQKHGELQANALNAHSSIRSTL